jgi:GTPase SAR1 family protein
LYDVTNRDTFDNVDDWIEKIKKFCGGLNQISVVLVGNKCDCQTRVVSIEEGQEKAA